MLTSWRTFTSHKINTNFPKVRFTYIKLRRKIIFKNNVHLTLYLREFPAIQTSQHTHLKEKTTAFPWRRMTEDPLVKIDQSLRRPVKRHFEWTVTVSHSDSDALIEELWADQVLLLKGAVKKQWRKIVWFKLTLTKIKMR